MRETGQGMSSFNFMIVIFNKYADGMYIDCNKVTIFSSSKGTINQFLSDIFPVH